MKQEKILNKISYILLAISVVIFYLANHYAHFEMDDVWYSTNLVTGEPLHSLGDIIESQIWHFNNWGGRSIAHGQLQLLLMSGEMMADILNVIALAAIITLILKHADAGFVNKPHIALLTLGLLIVLNANWYQTLFWQSGASNYLYMTTWILLFLYPYMRSINSDYNEANKPKYKEIIRAIYLIPLGLISGWSNENMGPTVLLITLAVIIISHKEYKKVPIWQITGSISTLIGSAFCILAPGNFTRVNEAANQDAGKGILWRTFLRCYSTTNGLLYYLIVPFIILTLLSFIYIEVLNKKFTKQDIIFIVAGIISWGAMILSPHYPDRAAFGSMIFFLIPIVSIINKMIQEREQKGMLPQALSFIVWLGGVFPPMVYICQQLGWINK